MSLRIVLDALTVRRMVCKCIPYLTSRFKNWFCNYLGRGEIPTFFVDIKLTVRYKIYADNALVCCAVCALHVRWSLDT